MNAQQVARDPQARAQIRRSGDDFRHLWARRTSVEFSQSGKRSTPRIRVPQKEALAFAPSLAAGIPTKPSSSQHFEGNFASEGGTAKRAIRKFFGARNGLPPRRPAGRGMSFEIPF